MHLSKFRTLLMRHSPDLVFIGLGNPGIEYRDTRHNIGFRCIDSLADAFGVSLDCRVETVVIGEGVFKGRRVILAKPRTFVNRSGEAVLYLTARYKIGLEKLVVVYDEMELPLGKIRLRPSGSSGGHNGIKSVSHSLGSQAFPRIRVGIGRPPNNVDPMTFVLGVPKEEERAVICNSIKMVVGASSTILRNGINEAMNCYN